MTETIHVNANATIPAEEPEPEPEPNATGPPRGPVTWDVPIRGSAFVGGTLTVQAGDTVRWTHEDGTTPHTVTADDGEFDSGYMLEGPLLGEYEFTFDEVAAFPYHCDVHPSMQNTITVLERFDGTP
jgi:plastocyanin